LFIPFGSNDQYTYVLVFFILIPYQEDTMSKLIRISFKILDLLVIFVMVLGWSRIKFRT